MGKAQVLAARGDVDEAVLLAERFLPGAREIADVQSLAPALLIAASVERARGRSDLATALVQEFAAVTADHPLWRLVDLPRAVWVFLDAGDRGAAMKLLEGQEPATLRERCSLVTARASLAETGDDPKSALELYGEAEALWEECGHVVYRSEAVLGAGRSLLAMGRSNEAVRKLLEAREVFAGLGARPLAGDADRLLERASGTGA